MAANIQTSKKYRETCGMAELKMDHFTDVSRALHRWLIENNEDFRKNSELSKARNLKHKQNRNN